MDLNPGPFPTVPQPFCCHHFDKQNNLILLKLQRKFTLCSFFKHSDWLFINFNQSERFNFFTGSGPGGACSTILTVSYGSEPNLWSIFNFQIPEFEVLKNCGSKSSRLKFLKLCNLLSFLKLDQSKPQIRFYKVIQIFI